MPRLVHQTPKYRHHKSDGRAVVTIDGRDIFLGPYGTKVSRDAYDRVIGEYLANGRMLPRHGDRYTVSEVVNAFRKWAEGYYVKPDGSPTSEVENFRQVLRVLRRLYGPAAAADFSPKALKAVVAEFVRLGWCRTHINRQTNRVKLLFKWAVSEEMAPPDVYHGLLAVPGIRRGKQDVRESEPVRPVAQPHVDAVLPLVSPQVKAMIELQQLTGARPGEVCAMRTGDIDRTAPLWLYRPADHKTAHHGHARVVYIGPKAQAVLTPWLRLDPAAYVFSPAEAEEDRRRTRHQERHTPASCGNGPGDNVTTRPERAPGDRYTVDSYRRAIERACDEAFPPPQHLARQRVPARGRKKKALRWESWAEWKARLGNEGWAELKKWRDAYRWHPHQLRHSAATRLRREFGIDAAKVILGHRTLSATQVYAEQDVEKARQIMGQVG